MFCVHCGKKNVEGASFCAFCGKAIGEMKTQTTENSSDWEYTFFRRYWKSGDGGRWNLTFGKTEYSVRMDNWGQDQDGYLPKIQKIIDKGWKPLSPPGPNSYHFRRNTDYAGSVKFTWLEIYSFVVEFRRPATQRTEKEKHLLGVWQETYDPNKGFWNTLGNVVFEQKTTVDKWKYEFNKDRTFHQTNRDGEKRGGGIFYENDKGEIQMFYKYSADDDVIVNVVGEKLIMQYDRPQEYEKIS